ncbi:hypothetical protein CGCF413_v013395 [Colletotrichum fructicola]|nr:hypothetical protein CGCF413_v013395 [Colletotrichum fructicola]
MYHFEYPITRPYPFKWFTPVAIIGCVILTAVFSLVNLTSNGFDLKPLYTTDVNGTEAAANARYAIMDPQNTNRFPGALLNNFTEPVQLDNGRFTKLPKPNEAGIDANVPLNESYGTIQPLMGPLSCNKATIAAQYLCSVPKQKSVGVMLLAIILADLVFLQAAWKLLQWFADSRMANRPQMKFCEGCLEAQGGNAGGFELEKQPRGRQQAGSSLRPNDRYVRLHSRE